MVKVREDMTGWKMWEHGVPDSRLIVIEQAEDYVNPAGRRFAQWLCQCTCKEKKHITVLTGNLKRGSVLSCGCFKKEKAGQRLKQLAHILNKQNKHKVNKYDLSGEYGIGYCSNTNTEFYFDLEDYDLIKDYCWCEHIIKNGYHAIEARDPESNTNVRMHWIVVGKYYDHIDRNPLNNRKENLRQATPQENAQNASIPTNNTTGYIGVNWHKQNKKWIAIIRVNNKQIYLGSFCDKIDAIKTRLYAELKYYGAFAPQRHLFEQYGINLNEDGDALS